ncbi:hypothetical protein [Ascidiaceihabitans sp.]|uniref:hypothetical protein n=1 Tax=Ascidiaceihabitans sp. TaxID=1872644 RepID=UPI00329A6D15
MRILSIFTILGLALGACSTPSQQSSKGSATVDGAQIIWSDIRTKGSPFTAAFPMPEGTSVFLFAVQGAPVGPSVQLSDGSTVTGTVKTCDLLNLRKRPVAPGLLEECRAKMAKVKPLPPKQKRSKASLIALSQQAIAQDGRCRWLGYDAQIDQKVRAFGSFASARDERVVFVKLQCAGL